MACTERADAGHHGSTKHHQEVGASPDASALLQICHLVHPVLDAVFLIIHQAIGQRNVRVKYFISSAAQLQLTVFLLTRCSQVLDAIAVKKIVSHFPVTRLFAH